LKVSEYLKKVSATYENQIDPPLTVEESKQYKTICDLVKRLTGRLDLELPDDLYDSDLPVFGKLNDLYLHLLRNRGELYERLSSVEQTMFTKIREDLWVLTQDRFFTHG